MLRFLQDLTGIPVRIMDIPFTRPEMNDLQHISDLIHNFILKTDFRNSNGMFLGNYGNFGRNMP